MKKSGLLKIIVICSILSGVDILASAQQAFRAGASKVNITPPFGTIINGDFLPMYTSAIHDSLYAKALIFDNGSERFAFIVVDNMTIDGDLIDDAKEIIRDKYGFNNEQVMVSSTHAHSCGSVIEVATCAADLSYRLSLPAKIAKSVEIALSNMQPAKISWGHIDVPKHVACRRWYMKPGFPMVSPYGVIDKVWMNPPVGSAFLDHPVSPTDPQVSYLAVKSLTNKWISILANYSTHYAGEIPENTISADYYGEIGRQLKTKLKADETFVGIMSNGTSGDVNTFDFRLIKNYPTEPYKKMELIANDISDSILVSLKNANWSLKPVFKIAYRDIQVARRHLSEELIRQVTERVKSINYVTLTSTNKASNDITSLYAMDVLKLEFYMPDSIKVLLQAIRIGDGTIGTLPGEFFSETGLKLKKYAPCPYYFSISLANAMIGYVPPEDQFLLGGYETWLCSGSFLESNAEKKIVNSLTHLIRSLGETF